MDAAVYGDHFSSICYQHCIYADSHTGRCGCCFIIMAQEKY